MIRIAITQAAFDAIAATLPLGSVSYENALDEGRALHLARSHVVDRLQGSSRAGRGLQRRDPAAGDVAAL